MKNKNQAQRFNYKTRKYEDYELPKGASMHEFDFNKVISCADCGKEMIVGAGYTSLEIHNKFGIGYMVCSGCHTGEIIRKHKRG